MHHVGLYVLAVVVLRLVLLHELEGPSQEIHELNGGGRKRERERERERERRLIDVICEEKCKIGMDSVQKKSVPRL